MRIYFTETESASEAFFREQLTEHDLQFVAELADVPADAEVLSVSFYSEINEAFLEQHPKLRFIATRSSGYDHIDLPACRARNITVSSVRSYGEISVAEHTFALILALARRLREALSLKRSGRFSFEEMRGFDLYGKTIGVIGTGRIGLHVIRLARSFGMEVLAYDTKPSELIAGLLGFTYVPFETLIERSHIITLHVPLTPATLYLINRETLAKCQPGALIINTSRGRVIDTEALLEALDSGAIGGAGLDVLEDERVFQRDAIQMIRDQIVQHLQESSISPEEWHVRNPHRLEEIQALGRNERLLAMPNVVFTPHTAFNSYEAVRRIDQVTTENLKAFLSGAPINCIGQ